MRNGGIIGLQNTPTTSVASGVWSLKQQARNQGHLSGSSGLFDGTGDYITAANSADFRFGSGAFTIEFWVRLNAVGVFHPVVNQFTNAARGYMIDIDSGNNLRMYGYVSSWQQLGLGTTTMAADTWHHCAITRQGTSFRVFIDGVLEDTTVISGSFTEETSNPLTIAYDAPNSRYLNGWLENFRITKGAARYTATFTPPSQQLPSGAEDSDWSDVTLLLYMTGPDGSTTFTDSSATGRTFTAYGNAQIDTAQYKLAATASPNWPPPYEYVAPATTKLYLPFDVGPIAGATPGFALVGGIADASRNAHTITVHGNAAVTTEQKKFGTHSLYLDGTGDYLELPIHSDFDTTTGVDFTLEFWWRQASAVSSSSGPLIGFGVNASTDAEDVLQFGNNSDVLYAIMYNGTINSYALSSAGVIANDSTWRHYSFNYDHSATTMKIYKDGTLVGTDSSFTSVPSRSGGRTNKMFIGGTWSTGGGTFAVSKAGHFDDLKFINGAILRTGNFTAPSAASGE